MWQVRIKLSGDGTNIGKRLHVICFTFTILEEEKTGSYEGNHIVAVFKEPESYDSLKNALADLIEEVEWLQKIEVGGISFDLDYYMGGDWKFLAMVLILLVVHIHASGVNVRQMNDLM